MGAEKWKGRVGEIDRVSIKVAGLIQFDYLDDYGKVREVSHKLENEGGIEKVERRMKLGDRSI